MPSVMWHLAELPGSGAATFDTTSIVSVERRFVVPWYERNAFAALIAAYPHPVYRYARPVRITITPLLGENEPNRQPVNPVFDEIEYQHALITVTYSVDPVAIAIWPSGIPVPPHRDGTTLELRLESGGEFLLLEGAVWADNPSEDPTGPVPEEGSPALRLYINQRRIQITWHGVDIVDAGRFEGHKGRVNMHNFLGCHPETLLFESYSIAQEIVLHPERPVRWAVTCVFLHRELQGAMGVYGWNHEFRRDGIQRVLIRDDIGHLRDRYLVADFTYMFT